MRPWTGLSGGVSVHQTLIYQDWQVRATFAVGSTSSASFHRALIPQKWVQTVALFMPLFPESFPFSSIALVPFIYFCTIVTLTTIYLITVYHFTRLEDWIFFVAFLWISVILLQ